MRIQYHKENNMTQFEKLKNLGTWAEILNLGQSAVEGKIYGGGLEKKKVKAAGTSGVETNARGKKKGKKFAERKAKEGKTVKQAKTTTTTAAAASSDGDEVVVEAEVMERAE